MSYKLRGPRRRTLDFGPWTLDYYSVAKTAMSAGIVSHNSPFNRKNKTPQNPNLFIQLLKLISILLYLLSSSVYAEPSWKSLYYFSDDRCYR